MKILDLKSIITKLRNVSNGLNSKSETEERVNELKNKPREIKRKRKKNEDSRIWETCGKVLEEIIAATSLVWWKTKIYISNINKSKPEKWQVNTPSPVTIKWLKKKTEWKKA